MIDADVCLYVLQRDSRYDGQIAVFGSEFQEKLADICYFLVSISFLIIDTMTARDVYSHPSYSMLRARGTSCGYNAVG